MSKFSLQELNAWGLWGFAEQRGNAWWYSSEMDDENESSQYPGAIPVGDVLRRVLNFQAVEVPVYVRVPSDLEISDGIDENGKPYRSVQLTDRKAIARDDTYDVLGMFKSGYQIHQYGEWLIDNVRNLLSTNVLEIASAGTLDYGAQAYVCIEMPNNIHDDKSGIDFRPRLLAATSVNGTLASLYKLVIGVVCCDNTLAAARSEDGAQYKVKHTKNSLSRIPDVQSALGLLSTMADDFSSELDTLVSWEVSEKQFGDFLDAYVPIADDASKRVVTMAETKRDTLSNLYSYDSRCEPWRGTALGVLQTTNTYDHHFARCNEGTNRAQRNVSNVLSGKFEESDTRTLDTLRLVTGYDRL